MAEIVNLRREAKRRQRAAAAQAAQANRARNGRSTAEQAADRQSEASRDKHLDAHRVIRPEPT